jgi:hypothetical protein
MKPLNRLEQEAMQGTPRYYRARRFAGTILHAMHDFLPQDRECLRRIERHLVELAFECNAEIICVPPELDHLAKVELEKRMLQKAAEPGVTVSAGWDKNP